MKHTILIVGIVVALCPAFSAAQSRVRRTASTQSNAPSEISDLATGWNLLLQGRHADALARAQRVLAANPRDAAALALAIEAEIGQGGADAGLMRYEKSLGKRSLEEPVVLRRIARAVLGEAAFGQTGTAAKTEALAALAAAGDSAARQQLDASAAERSVSDFRALAASGNEEAVQAIAKILPRSASPLADLEALGNSKSPSAVEAVAGQLQNPTPEIRGAAAEALSQLGGPELADRLKPLLGDSTSFVRVRAAAALYRIGDDSGRSILQELLTSPDAQSRLIAVEAMASRPDDAWFAAAKELLSSEAPEVRIGAARLLAPHDPQTARDVLESLANDSNLTIREMASEAAVDVTGDDLTGLRQALKGGNDPLTRVRAAARIVRLTD